MAKKAMQAKFEAAAAEEKKRKKKLWKSFLADHSPMQEKNRTKDFCLVIVDALIDGAVNISTVRASASPADAVSSPGAVSCHEDVVVLPPAEVFPAPDAVSSPGVSSPDAVVAPPATPATDTVSDAVASLLSLAGPDAVSADSPDAAPAPGVVAPPDDAVADPDAVAGPDIVSPSPDAVAISNAKTNTKSTVRTLCDTTVSNTVMIIKKITC